MRKFALYFMSVCFILRGINALKEFNKKGLPVIIWWSDLLFPHGTKVSEIDCNFGSCIASTKRKNQNNVTTAYIFYGTDFYADNLPLPRKDNDIWSLLHEESPMNNYIFSHKPGIQLFNYTGTFSRYSDFPLTTQFTPSIDYLLMNRESMSIDEKNKYRRNGTAPVMYLQSHCNVASDRDRYVKQLMRYIQIDSYGACLHNKDLPPYLVSTDTYNDEELFSFISKYKFHIAFENAICDDYITEKLFRALHVGSVPIYKGSPTIKDWVPSNTSVIVADDFEDPAELAKFLTTLDQNDEMYQKYLGFKEDGISNKFLRDELQQRSWGVNDPDRIDFVLGFECFVCDRIQQVGKQTEPSIANKKHMNCPQPHPSFTSKEPISMHDEWIQEDWIENYWFAYDQATAIDLMLINKEKNTSNFMHYISKLKYHN